MNQELVCHQIMMKANKGGFNMYAWYKLSKTTSLFEYGIRQGFLLALLFRHDFAAAYFGKDEWERQLLQLVLLPTDTEKLAYMQKFLPLST